MLIPWLEELEQSNSISKEAKQAIYNDCSDLIEVGIKTAQQNMPPDQNTLLEMMKSDPETARTFLATQQSKNEMLEAAERAREAQNEAEKAMHERDTHKAIAKYKALGFVNKGLNILRGPMSSVGEKFTRPVRIGYSVKKTNQFLEQTFPEKDVPKARARFEEILDYAPSLAQDPLTVQSYVRKTLHSGLTNEDKDNLRRMQQAEGFSAWDTGQTKKTLLAGKEWDMKSRLKKALHKSAQVRADHLATIIELVGEAAGQEKMAGTTPPMVHTGVKPGLSSVAMNALKTLALVSAVPLVAGGLTGIGKTLVSYKQKEKMKKDLEASYDKALSGKDDYSRGLREDRERARQAFEALVHFAPDVASQTGAAKAFMHKMVVAGGPEVGMTTSDIKDLADIQKNMAASKPENPFTSGFATAGKMTGLSNITSDTMKSTSEPFIDQSKELARAHLTEQGPGFISN